MTISSPVAYDDVHAVRRALDPESLVSADELAMVVANERPRQEVALAQNLEAVADAEHGHAGIGRGDNFFHDRCEPRDRAAAEVVAVRETAGQDHRLDALEIVVAVPEADRLATAERNRPQRIAVVEGTGKRDDADLHDCSTRTV